MGSESLLKFLFLAASDPAIGETLATLLGAAGEDGKVGAITEAAAGAGFPVSMQDAAEFVRILDNLEELAIQGTLRFRIHEGPGESPANFDRGEFVVWMAGLIEQLARPADERTGFYKHF